MPAAQINPSSSVLTAAVSIERERPNFPSDKKRRDALVLFNCGLGYSKVADILELNPNTVRDWAKSFLAGKFKTFKDAVSLFGRFQASLRDHASERHELVGH